MTHWKRHEANSALLDATDQMSRATIQHPSYTRCNKLLRRARLQYRAGEYIDVKTLCLEISHLLEDVPMTRKHVAQEYPASRPTLSITEEPSRAGLINEGAMLQQIHLEQAKTQRMNQQETIQEISRLISAGDEDTQRVATHTGEQDRMAPPACTDTDERQEPVIQQDMAIRNLTKAVAEISEKLAASQTAGRELSAILEENRKREEAIRQLLARHDILDERLDRSEGILASIQRKEQGDRPAAWDVNQIKSHIQEALQSGLSRMDDLVQSIRKQDAAMQHVLQLAETMQTIQNRVSALACSMEAIREQLSSMHDNSEPPLQPSCADVSAQEGHDEAPLLMTDNSPSETLHDASSVERTSHGTTGLEEDPEPLIDKGVLDEELDALFDDLEKG